jgi:hypothetical protein
MGPTPACWIESKKIELTEMIELTQTIELPQANSKAAN